MNDAQDIEEIANIDYERKTRCGFPEVIYGLGKTAGQIALIAESLLQRNQLVLATRIDSEKAEFVKEKIGDSVYLETPQLLFVDRRGGDSATSGVPGAPSSPAPAAREIHPGPAAGACCTADVLATVPATRETGDVVVCCAGTSDLFVAEEAAVTACLMGSHVELVPDIGIAGVHRTLSKVDQLQRARAIVCAAGMEGALPSFVAGLVKVPVIAVPTSVGYGANLGGVAALLSMVNSCAAGVSVVNIDNGFGAGQIAHRINMPWWADGREDG